MWKEGANDRAGQLMDAVTAMADMHDARRDPYPLLTRWALAAAKKGWLSSMETVHPDYWVNTDARKSIREVLFKFICDLVRTPRRNGFSQLTQVPGSLMRSDQRLSDFHHAGHTRAPSCVRRRYTGP